MKKNKVIELQVNIFGFTETQIFSKHIKINYFIWWKKKWFFMVLVGLWVGRSYSICNRMCWIRFCPCLGPVNPSAAALTYREGSLIRGLFSNNSQSGLLLWPETDSYLSEHSCLWAAARLCCPCCCLCSGHSDLWQETVGMTFCIDLTCKGS